MKFINTTDITSTTVKIPNTLYKEFKILGLSSKLSLQAFFEKCIILYVNDNVFRDNINSYKIQQLSVTGSFSL